MSDEPAVLMANITKVYPGNIVANDRVSLAVREGTIHVVVGENGAGKTTLMGILYGAVRPEEGRIRLRGTDVVFGSPADAIRCGIAMVTQHSSLIPALTLLDGVLLGHEGSVAGFLRRRAVTAQLDAIAARLGISVPWHRPARELTVAALQKAEIVRALYRGATVLILDEPTAALAPPEADALYSTLRDLAAAGTTVIVVTHRLHEVMEHASRVTVLRRGRVVAETETSHTSARELAAQMVGGTSQPVAELTRSELPADWDAGNADETPALRSARTTPGLPVLELRSIRLRGRKSVAEAPIDLTVHAGEIVGVAGVDGNGQRELVQAILGFAATGGGHVIVNGTDVSRAAPRRRSSAGLAWCPEDRQAEGLILGFDITENLLLPNLDRADLGAGPRMDWPRAGRVASEAMRIHGIQASSPTARAGSLSGGNQQKLLIARALICRPKCLVAMQPTRGLDIHAANAAFAAMRAGCANGMGVLLISLDLDELLEMSDRIAVLYDHRLVDVVPNVPGAREMIGAMMTTGMRPQ